MRLGKAALLLYLPIGLALGLGAPGLLQAVAWSGMLLRYSSEKGVVAGVTETFSGQRPCSLCAALAESPPEKAPSSPPSPPEPRVLLSPYNLHSLLLSPRPSPAGLENWERFCQGPWHSLKSHPPTPPPESLSLATSS
ncbi:MAG: hypothetical protein AAF555_04665 [Verrucomicrobiota bacterium]